MFKRRRNRQRQNSSNGTILSDVNPGSNGSNSTTTARNGKVHPTPSNNNNSNNNHKSPKPLLKNGRPHHGRSGGGSSSNADSKTGKVSDVSVESMTASTRSSSAVKHVRFTQVEIRQYERILGSNPSCSSGAPVGIGWGYSSAEKIELDDYESQKPDRKTQVELVLSRQERELILLEWGASFNEIVDAIRNNIKIKNQRRHTVNTLGRYDKWEEMMESAGRKFKRTILLQKTTGQRAKELSAQVQPAVLVLEAHEGGSSGEETKEALSSETKDAQEQQQQQTQQLNSALNSLLSQQLSQKSLLSEQHPASAAEASAHAEQQQLAAIALAGMGLHNDQNPTPVRRKSSERHESVSLDGGGPQHCLPLLEVDVFDTADVSSRISYDEDMTAYADVYEEEEDQFDYDDDGFGLLVRDTRHWFVDGEGSDGPHVLRRMTPLVISEDYNVYAMPQQAQLQQPYPHLQHQQQQHHPNMSPYPPNPEQFHQPHPQQVVYMTEQQWLYQGYSMQPPPYSQAMAVHWE